MDTLWLQGLVPGKGFINAQTDPLGSVELHELIAKYIEGWHREDEFQNKEKKV
jgi:hypothetical protein